MKKILYITLVEDPINNGILESQVISNLKVFAREGYQVTLFTAPSKHLFRKHSPVEVAQYKKNLSDSGINFHCLPLPLLTNASIRWWLIPFLILLTLPPILAVAIRHRIDIVHCRSYPASLIGMLVKLLTRKKFIFDMRGVYPEEGKFLFKNWQRRGMNFRVWKKLEELMLRTADHVVVVSDRFEKHIFDEYPELTSSLDKKISVIVCGIDPDTLLGRTESIRELHHPIRLVYSGSIDGWTTPQLLAKTFRQIVKNNPEYQFILNIYSGTNPDVIRKAFVQEGVQGDKYFIERLKVSEVNGRLKENDIGLLVRESSIVNEVSFPVKLGEYLAAGLPVVINSALVGAGEFVIEHDVGIVLGEDYSLNKLIINDSACRGGIDSALEELVKGLQSYKDIYANKLQSKEYAN